MPADRHYNAAADPRRRPPVASTSTLPPQPHQAAPASNPAPPTPQPVMQQQQQQQQPKKKQSSSRQEPYARPPELLRCQGGCGQDLPRHKFSKLQLKHRNKEDKAMMCEKCVPQQQLQMKCTECEKVKPVDFFATAQRNKNKPMCQVCQTSINDKNAQRREKGGYGEDEDDDDDSDLDEQRQAAAKKRELGADDDDDDEYEAWL